MSRAIPQLFFVYCVLTVGLLGSTMLLFGDSRLAFESFKDLGPGTNAISLLVSIILTWLLIGSLLVALSLKTINSQNVVTVVCGSAVFMLYLAIAREHVFFGDYGDYVLAAENIASGQPFHPRYLYPPGYAFLLAQIFRLFGPVVTIIACFVLNLLSLVGFFFLGSAFLKRCGLTGNLASILLFLSMIINVPVLRNVIYVQVNLLMLDLVLGAVLLAAKRNGLSSLCLALGTHLKIVPALFLPVFIKAKKWRWAIYYTIWVAAVFLLITLTDGISYFQDFAHNIGAWKPTALRSCSFYGFFVNSANYLGIPELPVSALTNVVRVTLALWIYYLSFKSIRTRSFADTGVEIRDKVVNGIIPLFFLMPVLSPTVWVHHLVILIIPTILIAGRLRSQLTILAFCFGYFFTFLFPVFDWYPWSYLRLGGWLVLLGVMSDVVISERRSVWIKQAGNIVDSAVAQATQQFRNHGSDKAV